MDEQRQVQVLVRGHTAAPTIPFVVAPRPAPEQQQKPVDPLASKREEARLKAKQRMLDAVKPSEQALVKADRAARRLDREAAVAERKRKHAESKRASEEIKRERAEIKRERAEIKRKRAEVKRERAYFLLESKRKRADAAALKAAAVLRAVKAHGEVQRWGEVHISGRRAYRAKPDVKLTCKCSHPNLIEMLDYRVCMNSQCLSGWVSRMAKRTTAGARNIEYILRSGPQVWEDFLQYFRCICWERIAAKGKPTQFYEALKATAQYIQFMHGCGTLMPVTQEDRDEDVSGSVSEDSMSLEDILNRDTLELVGTTQPYYYTLLREVIKLAPRPPSGHAILLGLAGHLEPQDVALLLDKPIAATVATMERVRRNIRKRA